MQVKSLNCESFRVYGDFFDPVYVYLIETSYSNCVCDFYATDELGLVCYFNLKPKG